MSICLRKTLALLILVSAFPLPKSSLVLAQEGSAAVKSNTIVLWVREVNSQVLYWVNNTPVGRKPLSGLVSIKAGEKTRVDVILDSRVPIAEMGQIDGVLSKIPVENARYYVYDAIHPTGMSEIIWQAQLQSLPSSPPR